MDNKTFLKDLAIGAVIFSFGLLAGIVGFYQPKIQIKTWGDITRDTTLYTPNDTWSLSTFSYNNDVNLAWPKCRIIDGVTVQHDQLTGDKVVIFYTDRNCTKLDQTK